jgi:hypothetical protein
VGIKLRMTKDELFNALRNIPDDMSVIASSESLYDIYEILSVKNLDDGVVYLELGK